MRAELSEGKFDLVRKDALAQIAAGAGILDVNAGVPGTDESALDGEDDPGNQSSNG